MALSSFTAFDFLEEFSRATPGLWNTPLSIISDNLGQLNDDAGSLNTDVSGISTRLSEVSQTASDNSTLASENSTSISEVSTSVSEVSTRLVGYDAGSVSTDLSIDSVHNLIVSSGTINSAISHSPSGLSSGTTGDIMWDQNFIYVCTSTDSWSRATLLPF